MSEKSAHIVIVTGQHMVANPRVWKEGNMLAENGYKVTILTTFYDAVKKEQDKELLHPSIQFKASVNLIKREGSLTDVYFSRIWRRIALFLKKSGKIDTAGLLLYRLSKQVKLAEAEDADLYIAHQETGLLVGNELLKKGKKVAFDLEDWYSRDYINEYRPVKMLREAESFALLNGTFCSCPSKSMALALNTIYKPANNIHVIYNGFPMKEGEALVQMNRNRRSIVWFSQTIGPGRGLETLMNALQLIPQHIEVHLAGECADSYRLILKKMLTGTGHSLIFHQSMKHKKIQQFLSSYTVALALENKYPDSRDTTVTNKILQYLQAGNKVLATNTKGQEEIAAAFPNSVSIVEVDQPEQWAIAIERLLENRDIRKEEEIAVFRNQFSWEAQEERLMALVKESLDKK